MQIYLFMLLASLAGGFIQAATGFGAAITVMTVFPLFLDGMNQASAVTAVLCVLCAALVWFPYRKKTDFKKLLPVSLLYCAVIPLSTRLSLTLPTEQLSAILGISLFLIGLYYLFAAEKARIPTDWRGMTGAGLLGGFLNGMFSIGGPPVVLYALSAFTDSEAYIAGMQAFFFLTGIYSVGVRALNGLITPRVLQLSAVGAVGLLIGIFWGRKLFSHMNRQRLHRAVSALIALTGLYTTITAFLP